LLLHPLVGTRILEDVIPVTRNVGERGFRIALTVEKVREVDGVGALDERAPPRELGRSCGV
jgi:hypothetical protein